MRKAGGIFCASVTGLSLLLWVAASVANAAGSGPRHNRGRERGNPIHSVAEPATIALLGAGLISLGIYAKRKQRKKS
jgi:hypothetical protein